MWTTDAALRSRYVLRIADIPENNEIVTLIYSNPLKTAGLSYFLQGKCIVQIEQKFEESLVDLKYCNF